MPLLLHSLAGLVTAVDFIITAVSLSMLVIKCKEKMFFVR